MPLLLNNNVLLHKEITGLADGKLFPTLVHRCAQKQTRHFCNCIATESKKPYLLTWTIHYTTEGHGAYCVSGSKIPIFLYLGST
jgi:hypothetical protein